MGRVVARQAGATMKTLRLSLFLTIFHPILSCLKSEFLFLAAFDKQILFMTTRNTHHVFRKVCSPAQCGSALFKNWKRYNTLWFSDAQGKEIFIIVGHRTAKCYLVDLCLSQWMR